MKIDLHGFTLREAIKKIILKIEDAFTAGEVKIGIIHGYNHGQVLKNYIRSEEFQKTMALNGFQVFPFYAHANKGYTSLIINQQ